MCGGAVVCRRCDASLSLQYPYGFTRVLAVLLLCAICAVVKMLMQGVAIAV